MRRVENRPRECTDMEHFREIVEIKEVSLPFATHFVRLQELKIALCETSKYE